MAAYCFQRVPCPLFCPPQSFQYIQYVGPNRKPVQYNYEYLLFVFDRFVLQKFVELLIPKKQQMRSPIPLYPGI